jgi:hypothetical protein
MCVGSVKAQTVTYYFAGTAYWAYTADISPLSGELSNQVDFIGSINHDGLTPVLGHAAISAFASDEFGGVYPEQASYLDTSHSTEGIVVDWGFGSITTGSEDSVRVARINNDPLNLDDAVSARAVGTNGGTSSFSSAVFSLADYTQTGLDSLSLADPVDIQRDPAFLSKFIATQYSSDGLHLTTVIGTVDHVWANLPTEVVPEPSGLALFLPGLSVLALRRRSKGREAS